MTTYVPYGLSYFLPANGNIELTSTDFASASGKIGPITIKLTNTDTANSAIISYDNPFSPPSVIEYTNVTFDGDGKVIHMNVDIVPATSATVLNPSSTGPGLTVGYTFTTSGTQTGGTSPANDLTWIVTDVISDYNANIAYQSGVIPGINPATNPIAPTEGTPTQTLIVAPATSEYVQFPGSITAPAYNPLEIYCSGANVYVTPVQIVA